MAEKPAVQIPQIDVGEMRIRLVGDSPLICHAWSAKARRTIIDKQMKKGRQPKAAKDPEADFRESLYPYPAGGYGFPCVAFKAAAVGACRFAEGVPMTEARGAFHVLGDLAKLVGEPTMREDMVRVGMGAADVRFRGQFMPWSTTLSIRYNRGALSQEQIVNLFNIAGFGVGIGEWRPEKNGSHGMFHVET